MFSLSPLVDSRRLELTNGNRFTLGIFFVVRHSIMMRDVSK